MDTAVIGAELDSSKASGANFRTLFENSSDAILIADLETQLIRYANPAAVRMLGYLESELVAKRVVDLSPKESLPRFTSDFEAAAHGDRTSTADVPCLRKNGTTVYADVASTLITIEGRRMLAGFFRDVSERREARRATDASEVRYRRLFETAKDGILILDAETGEVVDVNPFLMALTGYLGTELIGKRLWEIGMFKDIAASKASFVELQANEYVRYDDLPLVARDGHKVDVEFVSNVYRVEGEKVIQCNVRDISARKRADAERAMLTMAIEQAGEAVYITDAHSDIVYANPAFEATTGYSRAEVIGRNPRLLKSGTHPETFYDSIWKTVREGNVWSGRLVNRKKNGTLYTQEGTISAVRDATGTITGYIAVARDISSELKLEAQLQQAQKMEAVGRLAGGIAHDFNNILSVILSYASMIGDGLKSDEPLRLDIEEIKRAGLRATSLTRQLLAFSRQQILEPKVIRLDQIVDGMQKMLHRLLGDDIVLTILPATDPWNVKADAGQVEQIVMNLAINARDAMPQGGTLTIETKNLESDAQSPYAGQINPATEYVLLAVSDNGMGMDQATQARIFEPFFTTKARGKGTGLGLATVFGIVHQSGGRVSVYSEPGKGTTFKIFLPRILGATDVRSPETPTPETRRGTETILLVEDDDQVRTVAVDILRRHGYVVLVAANGGEALLVCEQHGARIDLLLTDVVLPRMSGRQLAERLAPMRPAMKQLFMSGHTDDTVLQHGILDSGVAYLQKPFTPASLIRKVAEVVRG